MQQSTKNICNKESKQKAKDLSGKTSNRGRNKMIHVFYKELKCRGYGIPKDKLIKRMKERGKCQEQAKKDSFSLVHGDFHRRTEDGPYAMVG